MLFPLRAHARSLALGPGAPIMILSRAGIAFQIDARAASHPDMRAQFALDHSSGPLPAGTAAEPVTLAYRRWWAERQPEARWASQQATGLFVIDVSHTYWREGAFVLTFDDPSDAQRFAMTFLARDQEECEAAMGELAKADG